MIVALAWIEVGLALSIAWVFWNARDARAEAAHVSSLLMFALIICFVIVSITLAVVSII